MKSLAVMLISVLYCLVVCRGAWASESSQTDSGAAEDKRASWADMKRASWADMKRASWADMKRASWADMKRASWADMKRASWADMKRASWADMKRSVESTEELRQSLHDRIDTLSDKQLAFLAAMLQ